jgi:hypothetical protein
MGVLINRTDDGELYKDAYEETQRIIRSSNEGRISFDKIEPEPESTEDSEEKTDKLTTSKLAAKLGVKTNDLLEKLVAQGYLEFKNTKHYITAKGKEVKGEFRVSPKHGSYFLWPADLKV